MINDPWFTGITSAYGVRDLGVTLDAAPNQGGNPLALQRGRFGQWDEQSPGWGSCVVGLWGLHGS